MDKEAKFDRNWWVKLGIPQYGGIMKIRASRNIENFDPYFTFELSSIYGGGWKGWLPTTGHWIRQFLNINCPGTHPNT